MKSFLCMPVLVLLLVAAGMPLNGTARLDFFRAAEQGNAIVLTWQAEEEIQVAEYELWRKTLYSSDFKKIDKTFRAHGPNKPYTHTDDQVYKAASELVSYQLVVVYDDGVREQLPTLNVNYTTTAVRRTWGSIKAMFQ